MLKKIMFVCAIALILPTALISQNSDYQSPESYFGFKPGADRELFNYQPLIDYLKILADKSPRVAMIEIGISPMGQTMYATFLSSEENIRNLDKLKKINQDLALRIDLTETEVAEAVKNGKVFVLATLSMHSTEVAPSQSAPLIAYEVATTEDQDLLSWLDDVVYMIVPSHNPDGMDLVVNNYKKHKGTKYEGSSLPEVYHKYVGHDNNRDFVTLTQSDNRAISELFSKTWMPQILVEKHQMGSYGPRYFVPPMHDPIAENVDEQIWNWTRIFGSNMSKEMSNQNLAGVSQQYLFDDYWPGSTETAIWKNVIGMLTEAASVQTATPIYIEKSELRVGGKGLGEYKKSINMPLPWEGGWWRLSDIIEYELATTWSIIKTSSFHKKEILQFRNDLCKKETLKGKTQAPYYYIFPADQRDPGELSDLLTLLDDHGVQIFKLNKTVEHKSHIIRKGDFAVPLAQAFRPFIKEILEKQIFPERHYTPDGLLIRPYDITSWSLPLHRGLDYLELNKPNVQVDESLTRVKFPLTFTISIPENATSCILPAQSNKSYAVIFEGLQNKFDISRILDNGDDFHKGDFLILFKSKSREDIMALLGSLTINPKYLKEPFAGHITRVQLPKTGLIETIFHDMDAGWTRYVLDSYNVPFKVLKPVEVTEKILDDFDVIIIPDSDKNLLLEAKRKRSDNTYSIPSYDPKLLKGMGKKGQSDLMRFIDKGGIVLSWGKSTELFMGSQSIELSKDKKEEFQFPVRNIGPDLAKKGVAMPGSLLKIKLKTSHPLCYGLPETINVFSRGTPVFATSIPYFDTDRRVLGWFPEHNILVSGYAQNEEKLAGKASLVWLKKGKGQLVLFGFNPQFRASTTSNYKLLFNGILLGN